ncbi:MULTISPECIES: Wadjet anti-phage system protein JetD domain-containing protein [unclassified Micromonospora]|uniref:Wadjet anti-phage system protein JetD domain-containing protein n=1 Tax=unclassified Micromonospora TaxID=2617518 RepID=UPI002FEE804D
MEHQEDEGPLLIRERFSLPGLPETLEAFAVYSEGKRPVRKGRFCPRVAEVKGADSLERFAPSASITKDELVWFLRERRRLWRSVEAKWGDRAEELVYELTKCGGLILKIRLDASFRVSAIVTLQLTPFWAEVAAEKLVELTGKARPAEARAALLEVLAGTPELRDEYDLLRAQDQASPLLPPLDTRTRASRWSPYEFSLRVAAWWYRRPNPYRKPPMDEAAAWAFPDRRASKEEWTAPRRLAVENILGAPLTELMTTPDYELRVRGPLQWRIGSVAADASVADPWTGLPSNGARLIGDLDYSKAYGVFVIENQTTFQEVCKLAPIVAHWVVVWGKGYAAHGLVELLKRLAHLPLAVWGDLDADGVRIIANMERKLGRSFHPVGMTAEYWLKGPHRFTTPDQNDRSIMIARELASSGPQAFRKLAQAMADHPKLAGRSREQQTLHDVVLPVLGKLLAEIGPTLLPDPHGARER